MYSGYFKTIGKINNFPDVQEINDFSRKLSSYLWDQHGPNDPQNLASPSTQ